jgi:tetratricopeptide (TPR) repeat protein
MEYDVFFSYPHKDSSEVERIHKALQDLGLEVWIDKTEILDFESITNSIVKGLTQSKVLLAYYSLNYWHSRACQWELTAAFLAAQSEGDPRKRILIINPEEKVEHIHPVELRDELFLTEFKDDDSLEDLVSRVKNHIQGITNVVGEIHALSQPRWYGNKGVGSNRFVGRLPDMWKIHSALHASGVPVITGSYANPVVQVQGMGGVGKSLLAEEYALRYSAAFPGGVFWLRAFGNDNLKTALNPEELEAERASQIFNLAVAYGIPVKDRSPAEIETQLSRELERNEKPFLWVVDDIPTGLKVWELKRWFSPTSLGRTLITTRSKEYSVLGKLVPLGVLEPEEAYELLTFWRKPESEKEKDAAFMLIADLGYHALAVEVAGAYLGASKGIKSFSKFRKELASPTRDELELSAKLKGVLPTGHEKSIASTFSRSIECLGEEGRDLLRLASMIAAAPIPPSLVSSIFSEVDKIDESSGELRAIDAISQADMLSLAERGEDEFGALSVHVLISRTFKFKDTKYERSEMLFNAAVSTLIKKLSIITDRRIHNELRPDIIHARSVTSSKDGILIANLMDWVARYDRIQGSYKSAETLLRLMWDIRTRILGDEHPDTLASINNLAITLKDQGDYAGARKLEEQVLELQRKTLGDKHPSTLNTMNNLANTLSDQGDYAGARKLKEQVLEVRRKVLGDEHPDTLETMSNLANTLSDQGDYDEARRLQEQVFGIFQKVLGDEHPHTLLIKSNLANTFYYQGDYTRARILQEQVLEVMRKVLGDEHPGTLLTMNNLAVELFSLGDYAGARNLQEHLFKIYKKVLGDEHPDTLLTMNNLANTLSMQGDYPKARKLQEHLLEISQKVLGDEHPSTLTTMNNLANTFYYQGDYAGAIKLYEQVFELRQKVLGDEHPDTLKTMNCISAMLSYWGGNDV